MRRLVYVSRSLIDADDTTIGQMVERSCVRNAAVGITGMLWFDGCNFAQVLEGEHDPVDRTIERIWRDSRHTDCAVVVDREVSRRAFGNWGMARPGQGPEILTSTAFLVGLSIAEPGPAARRLHDIVVDCEP